ncbi:host specificity factor TipJ family phage tail protein [Ruminobacter sp. RM87]|uniref:host specificity factor TipJ family phage tail protein n=1 Tax=Ruminobacter sp. RM87 TaxID=1200567 RepID=UPI0004E1CFF3|nr:host specificity factor TipJ family phage tail protein [Ruminobacter sp. RM87]
MKLEIVTREDLSRVLEQMELPEYSGSLPALMKSQITSYNPTLKPYLSLYVNGRKVEQTEWQHTFISRDDHLKFVIEPGVTGTAIAAIISVVVAVASAVYAMVSMNKLGKHNQKDSKQGNSIYDVNVQGNKVKLMEIIPENFGFFKRYPDYLADKHVFYRNNTLFCDMILCQGIGYYDYKSDHSDIYIGETPISELKGCAAHIIEPGVKITAENSPEDKSWYCWYSSTEVTQSGHTLKSGQGKIDTSSKDGVNLEFSGKTFSGFSYQSFSHGYGGCSGGGTDVHRIRKTFDLKWADGTIFELSGVTNTRRISTEIVSAVSDESITVITVKKDSLIQDFSYLRARQTEVQTSVDEETGEETQTEVIVRNGDYVRISLSAVTSVSYDTIPSGSSGGKSVTEEESNDVSALCEILEITADGDNVTLKFDSSDLTVPAFPDTVEPSQPYTKITDTANRLAGSVFQPMPADYPYDDNGFYEIVSFRDGVYMVKRLNDSYGEIAEWPGFFSSGINQEHTVFTLVSGMASDGGYVGPYRACPYGAVSNIFELDFSLPSGLGKLNDDGDFEKLTITIQIEYRRAGSDDEYTVIEKSWTNSTNDQLAETIRLELDAADNYEFRVLRTSKEDGSTRALEEIKWTGLKSVISTIDRYDNMTVLICRFKGNETLSELSENQLATYWTRKLPAVGYSDNLPLTPTRDIAPVVQYIVRKSKYRNILDVDTLMEFDELWRSQGLECNGSIDSDSTLLESLRDVLNCGFAVPVVRDNTLSVKRLHAGAQPVQIFTKSNMTSSPVITYSLPKDDDVNEVVVNFTSPETYKTETVYCHIDEEGNKRITDYPESDNQERLDAWGVTDREHAIALGMRRLRYLRNTRVTYDIKTELNGLNCQFNDLVGLMLDENLSNITGRITGINGQTVTTDIELPEDIWEGIVYISRKDGSYGEYTFYRNDSHTLYLDTYPDIDWDSEFGKSLEYPLFAIGELQLCWVTAVKPESNNRCSLSLINYSEDIFKDDIKEKNQ